MAGKSHLGALKLGRPLHRMCKAQGSGQEEFALENVCGVSRASRSALAANPSTTQVAFPASSVLVTLDPRYSEQEFLENPTGRNINAVTFSDDGKYVAFGEVGYNPSVFICHAADRKYYSRFQVNDMCSIKAIEFHPRSIYLAVLCASSFSIALYELKGKKIAMASFVVEPLGMTLPKVGSSLVVCGHRKISLFSLMDVDTNVRTTNIVFDRRSVLLGHQSEYTFVDVVSGSGTHIRKVYTVTSCGYICDLKVGDILIDRATKIDDQCFCVTYSFGCLFVGCGKKSVKICSPVNLLVVTTISDQDAYGFNLIQPCIWKFEANTVAIAVNSSTRIVTCVYSDHNRYYWRIILNKSSIEVKAVIPVDSEGNEVTWQPTSYEIQSKIANVFNPCHGPKAKESSDRINCGSSDNIKGNTQGLRSSNFGPITEPYNVNATRFTPDGKTIICGNFDGEIKIFDALTGRLNRVIEAHSSAVTHIELLFDDHFALVASGGRDRVIFILDARKDHSLVQVLCDHSSAIVSISMAHLNGTLTLVSSAADGVILIRRAIKGKQLRFVIVGELSEFGGKPRIYAHVSDYIITGGDNGHFNLFSTEPFISTKPIKTFKGSTRAQRFMKAVAIDPSGSYLVANSAKGTLVFNIQTGKHVSTLTNMSDVSVISFSNDCNHLVSESNNGCRFLWRLPEKISEVIKTKLGITSSLKQSIPYETVLSFVNVTLSSPTAATDACLTEVHLGESQEAMTIPTSKLCYQDNYVAPVSSIQQTPSECLSYSSCTTCSRSYTDVFDCSRSKTIPDMKEYNGQIIGLSEEAERLLDNNGETKFPANGSQSQKPVRGSIPFKRFPVTGKPPRTNSISSSGVTETAIQSMTEGRRSNPPSTRTYTSPERRMPIMKTSRSLSAKSRLQRRPSPSPKRTTGLLKRRTKHTSKERSPAAAQENHVQEISVDHISNASSPSSNYASAISTATLYPENDTLEEKTDLDAHTVSKTIGPSDIVSEMHDTRYSEGGLPTTLVHAVSLEDFASQVSEVNVVQKERQACDFGPPVSENILSRKNPEMNELDTPLIEVDAVHYEKEEDNKLSVLSNHSPQSLVEEIENREAAKSSKHISKSNASPTRNITDMNNTRHLEFTNHNINLGEFASPDSEVLASSKDADKVCCVSPIHDSDVTAKEAEEENKRPAITCHPPRSLMAKLEKEEASKCKTSKSSKSPKKKPTKLNESQHSDGGIKENVRDFRSPVSEATFITNESETDHKRPTTLIHSPQSLMAKLEKEETARIKKQKSKFIKSPKKKPTKINDTQLSDAGITATVTPTKKLEDVASPVSDVIVASGEMETEYKYPVVPNLSPQSLMAKLEKDEDGKYNKHRPETSRSPNRKNTKIVSRIPSLISKSSNAVEAVKRSKLKIGDKEKHQNHDSSEQNSINSTHVNVTKITAIDDTLHNDDVDIPNDEIKNINQNTVVSDEKGGNSVYLSKISLRKNSEKVPIANNVIIQRDSLSNDSDISTHENNVVEDGTQTSLSNRTKGIACSQSQTKHNTQLSNSQETFFDCISDVDSNELLQDLKHMSKDHDLPKMFKTYNNTGPDPKPQQKPETFTKSKHASCKWNVNVVNESPGGALLANQVGKDVMDLKDFSMNKCDVDKTQKELLIYKRSGNNCRTWVKEDKLSDESDKYAQYCEQFRLQKKSKYNRKQASYFHGKDEDSIDITQKVSLISNPSITKTENKFSSILQSFHVMGKEPTSDKDHTTSDKVYNRGLPDANDVKSDLQSFNETSKAEEYVTELAHVDQACENKKTLPSLSNSCSPRISPPRNVGQSGAALNIPRDGTTYLTSRDLSAGIHSVTKDTQRPTATSQTKAYCQQNVIEGLGSVVELFRNQDDYLRKLREVRRNFEVSIQALKDNRKDRPNRSHHALHKNERHGEEKEDTHLLYKRPCQGAKRKKEKEATTKTAK